MASDKDRDSLLEEYEKLTKDALLDPPEDDPAVDAFLKRVLGPELHHWMDRGRKYGYWGEDEVSDGEDTDVDKE